MFKQVKTLLMASCLALFAPVTNAQPTVMHNQDWPFIIIRHAHVANNYPKVFDKILDIAIKYPGACDEVWLCGPGYADRETLVKEMPVVAQFHDKCDKNGVKLSFQQGITVGHGTDPGFKAPRPRYYAFAETDFMCDQNGTRLYGQLCPRSENVQKFAYEYAKAVLEITRPSSYWLDDDLRLGVSKPMECFCDRCIAEFNRQNGTSYTREKLANELFNGALVEPVREKWCAFNGEAIAIYAAQLRKAADDVMPDCRLGYQSVWSNAFYCGTNYQALLKALSGKDGKLVGIRPGALHYTEDSPRGMIHKSMSIMREGARCRRYGFVASIAYEQENYTRKVLHKSPEAIMIESTLALASGCDSLSEYYYDSGNHEPLDYYEDFSRELSEWRPYLERVGASTRRTRLAGMARFLGRNAYNHKSFNLDDGNDESFAMMGLPVTVQEDEPDVYFVTRKTIECMVAEDFPKLLAKPVLFTTDTFAALLKDFPEATVKYIPEAQRILPNFDLACKQAKLVRIHDGQTIVPEQPIADDIAPRELQYGVSIAETTLNTRIAIVESAVQYPTAYRRQAILDGLDAITDGAFPARLDSHQAVRMMPHVGSDGKVDSVTLLNLSIGHTRELRLRVRHPRSQRAVLARPKQADAVPLAVNYDTARDELRLTLPQLPAWQPVTLFF